MLIIFFTVASLLGGAFILQASHFFAFGGIQPNLFLIILYQCVIFLGFSKNGFLRYAISAGFAVFWLFLFFPFWRLELLTLLVASFFVFWGKYPFSTNEYIDIVIFIPATQILFYGALWFIQKNTHIFSVNFLYETTASVILGLIFLYLIQKIRK